MNVCVNVCVDACTGLATCYALVTLMNGSISYKSEQGVGTTFRIMLPLEAADMVPNYLQYAASAVECC